MILLLRFFLLRLLILFFYILCVRFFCKLRTILTRLCLFGLLVLFFFLIVRPFLLPTPYHTVPALLVWSAGFVFSPFVRLCLPFDFLDFSACISPPHPLTYPIYAKVIQTKTVVFYSLFRSFKYLTIF